MRTQIGIVGAGPAGLLLSHLLHLHGISSVVLEAHGRDYVEARVRAGVLEHRTADTLRSAGVGTRLDAQGLPHQGIELRFEGRRHRVAMTELTGRHITVYGQQEVVKDLIARRIEDGGEVLFDVSDVQLDAAEGEQPVIDFTHAGRRVQLRCDFIAGCDGFHGVSRRVVPQGVLRTFTRDYPFAWLGILAAAQPAVDELVYCLSERGFALYSMGSATVSRLYLQVAPDERIEAWTDERIWDELDARFALADAPWGPTRGPLIDRGSTPMRSVVTEPMQHRRVFFAGDAVHIVPPTGAKGMNLAVNDVRLLSRAFDAWYAHGSRELLDSYSADALERVWRAQHFSWWMTSMLHRMDPGDPYQYRLQLAQLRNVVGSPAYATALAENYVG
jgi:p-hydroxybenzoate 3-monooxygenase